MCRGLNGVFEFSESTDTSVLDSGENMFVV